LIDQDKIHNQCFSADPKERMLALDKLKYFSQVPDKQLAWNDLHRLTTDENSDVRYRAAYALGSAFSQVPDKQLAWNDLHRLTTDEDGNVRSSAAYALGSAFSQVPDKQLVWNDLHRLTTDENSDVRSQAADALGSAFSQVPDEFKQLAWNDLHRLTTDENSDVRTFSNHSLGRVYIFKASQAETDEDYKKELEKAIEFFEKAAQNSSWLNPSKFCLPFYRSFHAIIFKKRGVKEEVGNYLAEAKNAVRDSKNKELLFEAIENLAKALEEVHNWGSLDLRGQKCELDSYRKYCDHATELMRDVEEATPFATKTIMKGLPILDRILKRLIEEIQEKARIACKEAKGTNAEEITCTVSNEVQKWEVSNQEEMTRNIKNLILIFKAGVPNIPENKSLLEKIEKIGEEKDLTVQFQSIITIISSLLIIQARSKNNDGFIGSINAPSTIAAFGGFLILEFLNMIYPAGNFSHLTCLIVAIAIFVIIFIIQRMSGLS
jgi:HEAT repeat protein